MSDYTCFLVTVLYDGGLLKCALKVRKGTIPYEAFEFPMEHRERFHKMLPLHVKSCGPIVEMEEIFEIAEAEIQYGI